MHYLSEEIDNEDNQNFIIYRVTAIRASNACGHSVCM